jgi:UDP-N-acetylmuramoyl-tripeptide--D-alanyl-D-alanine ligase
MLLAEDALMLDGGSLQLTSGRGDRHGVADGGVVIADAYNANPESMRAALEELAATTRGGRRVAVLGRMAELGPTSMQLHAQVGAHAAGQRAINELVVVGEGIEAEAIAEGWLRGRGSAAHRFDDVDAALEALEQWHQAGDAVLVKASNSSGLGRLAEALVERFGGGRS